MPEPTLREMLKAGVHFGHQTSRWNPKMRPYIYTSRNGVHVIDLQITQVKLQEAVDFLQDLAGHGKKVLFVGTKKQAQDAIEEVCRQTGDFYVTHRWMGGMLTNFAVIQKRLKKMKELRQLREQGDFERMSRKEANVLEDELVRLESNFGGMVEMRGLPGALVVVDCKKEKLAVTEANRLRIPVVAIVDTNVDPELIEYPIPGNDDAIRAVRLLITRLGDGLLAGKEKYREKEAADLEGEEALAELEAESRGRGNSDPEVVEIVEDAELVAANPVTGGEE